MEQEQIKKLIVMSILAYGIATFLLAMGLLTKTTISIILFYLIAIALIICAILALYNNYKKNSSIKLFIYLIIVGCFFLVLNTVAFINVI
ncbi:hypothetical protein [uncultured Thomasclavelia sp.]|uniref:hypothetical protein n=1 Tax=uncultured Thomasclavelia sp. TaxID=3025759 RepID=UPI0025FA8829|nr:hypothetical protein [uncultured Thomasclavelia sp.]